MPLPPPVVVEAPAPDLVDELLGAGVAAGPSRDAPAPGPASEYLGSFLGGLFDDVTMSFGSCHGVRCDPPPEPEPPELEPARPAWLLKQRSAPTRSEPAVPRTGWPSLRDLSYRPHHNSV